MTTVVTLDALGTLVELRPPAPRLRRLLAGHGFELSEERAELAMAAEIECYLAHHLEGHDPPSLERLRARCAEAMRSALALPGLDRRAARAALQDTLEFAAYDDAAPALRALREMGRMLIVVSNWDCSLPEWLAPLGLLELVDAVVTSAAVGEAKPGPAPFLRALALAGADPADALHVGDSLANDVAGARAVGARALLVRRRGARPRGVECVRSLAELPALV